MHCQLVLRPRHVAQAGQCLDLDCAADAAVQITGLVQGMPGVSRTEPSASGLTVFLRGDADPDDIVRRVLRDAHADGIVLFHESGGDRRPTVASLGPIISELSARGFEFVTIGGDGALTG